MYVTNLYGKEPEKAILAIRKRRDNLVEGKSRQDGRKLGLVIEGGGMRSVCSAGGAVALAQLGFSNVFDNVFVTSAAVMNASYLLTNQPLLGLSVYFENCRKKKFLNPFRFWKILDVDYIVDQVVTELKPLDIDKLLASPSMLSIAMINTKLAQTEFIDLQTKDTCPKEAFRAAMALPLFYNRSVQIGTNHFVDAGMLTPFPIAEALQRGCTDILVLTTRPVDHVEKPDPQFAKILVRILGPGGQSTKNLFERRHTAARDCRRLATGKSPVSSSVHIATLCAEGPETLVNRTTTDLSVLLDAAQSYRDKTASCFGEKRPDLRSQFISDLPEIAARLRL